ncbi:hypothetical protein FBU30_000627 [Linnemannia zychae]|nr:hypothetical protein FBU30_000627 [Linnemannia zychae]
MTPHFRLQGSGVTHKQRILIADAMSLCFYLAIGALAFIYLERWTFLDALFFVMVTITTIGFGDRTPQTTGGRIFVIIYGACGIVLLALAVNAIRYVILEDLHRRFSIKAKERKLKRDARRRERRNQHIHQEEQQSQIQQAIERLQTLTRSKSVPASGASMPLEASSVSRDTLNESHYLTLFPRYFNISNDHHLRLPSLFTHTKSHPDPDLINGSSNQQNGVSNTDLTPEDDSSQNANDMLETSSINNSLGGQAEHDAAGVGSDTHVDDTQENRQAVDDDLLRYATVYPDESYQSNRIKSWLNRFFCCRQPPLPVIVHHPTLEEQREADKRQAYKESMDEYKRRLRFSASIFMIFWLVGAIIFTFVESWGFGSSVYFVFIAFSTIGYGDLVPRTIAGRAIFLGYCLVGVVTLTSLASMIAEVLSKSMRKHVVKAHLRRAVLLEALEDSNGSPESHAHEASTTEVISADGLQATETTPEDKTCCGVLQNLINVSKSLDGVLQTILGLESTVLPDPSLQFMPANPNPGAIISYLEENEDDSEPSYLSPSISRDINSTSTIHQHSLRPLMHARQHSNELQHRGTFPSTSPARQKNPSQLKITAWPTVGSPSASQHHWRHNCSHSQPSTPPPELYQKSSASHNNDDHIVTIPGAQWKILVEYSKRFKTLTLACEEALKKVTEWETSEKRLRQKRNEARQKLKTWIAEYRKKLEQLKDSHVSPEDDLEEEEELEELDEWDEEGSNDDDDDRDLDNQRAQIAATLLGPLSENPANLPLPNLSRRLSTPPTRWSSRRHNSPRSEQHQRRSSLVQEHHDRFRLRQHKMNRDQRLHHHDQDLEQGNAEQSSETVAKGVDSD